MPAATRDEAPAHAIVRALLPFTLAIFLGFLAVGLPVAVLPPYVHGRLGFGTVVVGIIVGLQSAATLLTRALAGRLADAWGARRVALLGLAAAFLASLCYVASVAVSARPLLGLGILALGRLLLGLGESLFVTAFTAWSIAVVGHRHTGRAMAWSGVAMYAALALGAPVGVAIDAVASFAALAACGAICPLAAIALSFRWRDAAPVEAREPVSFLAASRRIWTQGIAMALASSGVGTITAFLALRYQDAGWSGPGLALFGFGMAYLAMRFLFGGLPDRLGGYRTALVSLAVEAIGLGVIWRAPTSLVALAGATLTGLGYSLVFPSLGVEAMRRVSSDSRGLVLGIYLACFDLGIAVAGPIAGLVTDVFDLPAAFAAAAFAALAGLVLTAVSAASL